MKVRLLQSTASRSLCAIALGSSLTIAAPAAAQDGAEAANTGNRVIVTAQRRAQDLVEVPIAITAYDQQTMDTLAVKKTVDLVDTIPNLVGSNNTSLGSANVYFLRGQGQDESFPTFDPAVGTYVDEIFYSRQNGNNINLFDVERIEVLRGPQGTLFGKNTTGGAINVIIRRPGDEVGGFFETSYGRFDEIVVRGTVDLPASESARFAMSGFYVDDNGWLENTALNRNINDRHSWGMRGAADIDIGSNVNWYGTIDYIDDDGTNIAGRDVNADTTNPITTGDYGEVDLETTSLLPLGLDAVFPGAVSKAEYGSETRSLNITSNLEYDGDFGTVNFIAGYRDVENDFLVNFPLPQFDAFMAFPSPTNPSPDDIFIIDNLGDYEQHSLELKYNGDLFDDFINLTLGLYYLKEENRSDFAAYFAGPTPSRDRIINNDTRNIAGYAQADINLTDQLTATLGIRYTDEEKTFDVSDNRPTDPANCASDPTCTPTDLTTANMIALGIPTEQSEKVWTPRFALTFEATPDAMFYASATRGFRSGGWNARSNNVSGLLPFASETVWSYEVGTRLSLGDALSIYATGYHLDVSDLQINTSTGGGTFLIGNAGKMKNTGLEVEAILRPLDGLNLYAALGLQDARYKPSAAEIAACDAIIDGGGSNSSFGAFDADCNVAVVKRTPDYQVTLGGSYEIDLGSVTVTPRASLRSVDDHVTTSRSRGPTDAFTLVNAGVDFGLMDDNLTLSVECANCFNERYLVATFGNNDTYFNRPGTWTIRARWNFGARAN